MWTDLRNQVVLLSRTPKGTVPGTSRYLFHGFFHSSFASPRSSSVSRHKALRSNCSVVIVGGAHRCLCKALSSSSQWNSFAHVAHNPHVFETNLNQQFFPKLNALSLGTSATFLSILTFASFSARASRFAISTYAC